MRGSHFSDIMSRALLIVGDVGSGKTALTARLLNEACSKAKLSEITLIEMAPERKDFNRITVGGRLADFMALPLGLKVLAPSKRLSAPRMEGRTARDVVRLASLNAQTIEKLFHMYSASPTPILFLNDVSMYLQTGDPMKLITLIKSADTAVANSYEGHLLREDHGSGVSQRELEGVTALKKAVDLTITLEIPSRNAHQQITT